MTVATHLVTADFTGFAGGSRLNADVLIRDNVIGVAAATGLTPPLGYVGAPVKATVDNGVLLDASGNTGVMMTSNDAQLNLAGDLQYTFEFFDVKIDGVYAPDAIPDISYTAPTGSTAVDLIQHLNGALLATMPVPQLPVSGLSDATTFMKSVLIGGVDAATVRSELGISGGNDWEPFANFAAFPATGNTLLEYVAQDTGKLYRWNGSAYIQVADKNAVGLGNVDNTSDAAKPVSAVQQAALDLKAPLVAGTFPWPQGLVALWDFQHDTAGGSTVTSRVGSQSTTLTARGSKTVVKDAADPGPFGASLVLDGATVFVKDDNLGALDVSTVGNEVTMVVWVKDTSNNHESFTGIACRAGSHCEGSTYVARQYADYFDASGYPWSNAHFTPHVGAQDGASPGYPFNHDYAASHRKYFTGTGQGQWHMEAFTFDGAQIIAYVDGMSDVWQAAAEPPPSVTGAFSDSAYLSQVLDRNPYVLPKGINRSQSVKRFTLGGSTDSPTTGINYTTGKLGGVAVFNKALSAREIMQIRLATLLPAEPITMFSFEMSSTGAHSLQEIGWSARGGSTNVDVSTLTSAGTRYAVTRPAGGTKSYLTVSHTAIGATWGTVTGLDSSQLRRVRFKLLNQSPTSAPQQVLVKVGDQWWASKTTFVTTSAHSGNTDWTGAETQTLTVSWDVDNWYPVNISDTGGTASYTNMAKNPALSVNATNWFTGASVTNATASRVAYGSGFAYEWVWTGGDTNNLQIGGLNYPGIGAVTAASYYAASAVVKPNRAQKLKLQIIWYDSANAVISTTDGGTVNVGKNTEGTLTAVGQAPTGATQMAVAVASISGARLWVSGDTLFMTKVLVVAGTTLPAAWFNGDTAGASWTGTAGASTSTITGVAVGDLSIGGSTNTAWITNAPLSAIGFLTSGGDSSQVRISDLELLPT